MDVQSYNGFGMNSWKGSKVFWSFLILILPLAIYSFQIDASGETMDEWFHFFVSGRTMAALRAWDFSPQGHQYRIDLPPVYKYIYGLPALLTNKIAPANPAYSSGNLTYARLTSSLLTALTAVVVLWFGWEFLSPQVGAASALIFAFLPPIVAYAKVLSSDTPGVLFFTLSVYLFTAALHRGGNNLIYLLCALVTGLTISSKYNNFLIFILLTIIFFSFHWAEIRARKILAVPLFGFLIFPISLFIFFAIWPWLWTDPFSHLVESLDHWVRQGSGFASLNLQYFPVYFAVTTPALILGLFSFFFYLLLKFKKFESVVLVFWFLVPFLVTFSKYKIDGIRFITAALVPVSLMAGLAVEFLGQKIKSTWPKLKFNPGVVLAAFVFLYLLIIDFKFHPYYLDYFNEIVGGPRGAVARGIPVGFWGEGVKEAVDYVNKEAPRGAAIQFAVSQPNFIPQVRPDLVRLKPVIPEILQSIADPSTFVKSLSDQGHLASYIIQYQVGLPEVEKFYEIAYQTKVLGYPLATVYRLKESYE